MSARNATHVPSSLPEEASHALRQDALLGRICRAVAVAESLPAAVGAAADILRETFGAVSVGVWGLEAGTLRLQGTSIHPEAPAEIGPRVERLYGQVPLEGDLPIAKAVRAGAPFSLSLEDPELDADQREILRAAGINRLLVLPMLVGSVPVGCTAVGCRAEPNGDPEADALLETTVQQLAILAHRERLIARDRQLAIQLRTLAIAVENLPDGIVVVGPDGTIRDANPAAQALFGHALEELRGMPISNLRGGDDPKRLQHDGAEATARDGWRGEIQGRHRCGLSIPLHLTRVPVPGDDGRTTAIVEVARDLRAEKEREQRAMEVYRLAGIGEVAASVAHEVNNPLGAIANFAELLLMEPLPAGAREDLQAVRSEAARAGAIVRNLLGIARQRSPEKRCVSLEDVMGAVFTLRKHVLELAHISLHVEHDPETPCVIADPLQLQQVLHNLLTNARQAIVHSGREGRIMARIGLAPDGMVQLTLDDTGPGIPAPVLEHIFDAFFTTKCAGEGTGLGLSISARIVEEHGGTLTASNWGVPRIAGGAPGEGGARFVLRLPADPEWKPGRGFGETPAATAPAASRPRVLIVEDEPAIAHTLQRYLSRIGFEAVAVLDAAAALEKIEAGNRYPAIVSDLKMSGMDGAAFYGHVAERWPEQAEAFIFTSGDVMDPPTHHFLVASERPVFVKPYDLKELSAAVDAVARRG